MDPADELYTLSNSFQEICVGDQEERAAAYLERACLDPYVTEALSLMVQAVGSSGTISSNSNVGAKANVEGKRMEWNGSNGLNQSKRASKSRPSTAKATKSKDYTVGDQESGNQDQENRKRTGNVANNVSSQDPLVFLQDYFKKVAQGQHVIDSRFAFIIATAWNRHCFVKYLCASFNHIAPDKRVAQQDFLHLVRIYCDDFSSDLVRLCWSLYDHHACMKGGADQTGAIEPVISVNLEFKVALETVLLWLVYGEFFQAIVERLCKQHRNASLYRAPGLEGSENVLLPPSWWDISVTIDQVVETLELLSDSTEIVRPPRFQLAAIQDTVCEGSVRDLFLLILGEEIGLFRNLVF